MTRLALVLGLGRFGGGRAAAATLLREGWRVRVADPARRESLAEAFDSLRACDDGRDETSIEWRLGVAQEPELLDGVDLCVVNPAVRPGHPVVLAAAARGIDVTQEVELFLDRYPGRVVFVTGTNGKSTTSTLLAHALRRGGIDTLLGGNIGRSLLDDIASWHAAQVAVLEVSSAQLARLDPARRKVEGAVLTRVTRDHLDWHGSIEAYHAAKLRALLAARRFVVHALDDPLGAAAQLGPGVDRWTYLGERAHDPAAAAERAPTTAHVDLQDGWLRSHLPGDEGAIVHLAASPLVGAFHAENLAAAFLAARALGVGHEHAALGLVRVAPLPHRLQLALRAGGRSIYGNGVSTEVQSTLSAIDAVRALPGTRGALAWVGGGKSKDGDFAGVAERLAGRIDRAHLFGAAAEPLGVELARRDVPTSRHVRLEDALDAAWCATGDGDSVLFSPAFASFDQYDNFRARAAAFDAWVAARRS